MSKLLRFAGLLALALPASRTAALPPGFLEETVVTGLDQPVGLVFSAQDRMFVWEKTGRVWIVDDGVRRPDPFLDLNLEVNTYWTRGLTGFALDPDYETNGYVYLLYTVDWEYYVTGGDPNENNLDTNHDTFGRLVRYTSDPDDNFESVLPGSRWEMIGAAHENGFIVTFASHTQNSIVFGPDGTMLLSAGDGASMLEVDTGGARNPCCSSNTAESDGIVTGSEKVGAFRSQLVDSHSGKILRIDPATAEGVPSNPYYDAKAPSAPRSRVWSLGYRNPYTFAIVPGTGSVSAGDGNPGVIVVGDVGWDSWERFMVNTAAGQNFGWPVFEGLRFASGYSTSTTNNRDALNPLYDGDTCTRRYFRFTELIVQETLNTPSWPNPCDPDQQIPDEFTSMHHRSVAAWRNDRVFGNPFTHVPIFLENGEAGDISITHPESPVTGFAMNGRATVGGVFYTGNKFPADHRGSFFFADAGSSPTSGGWLHRAVLDESHALVEIAEVRTRDEGLALPTGLAVDPAGYGIYYANHIDSGQGSIRRITYDCNGNGTADDEDLENGASDDENGNGIPDECDTPGDVNGDGVVDFADVLLVLAGWGDCPDPPAPCPEDVNDDGAVDFADILVILANWG